jgi:beta-lysine 5,6-aminomutase alpha subunit
MVLDLDPKIIERARRAAAEIADEMDGYIRQRSTVAVERTTLRLLGVDGINPDDVPLPNVVVDAAQEAGLLEGGIMRVMARAVVQTGRDPQTIAEAIAAHELDLKELPDVDEEQIHKVGEEEAQKALRSIAERRQTRDNFIEEYGEAQSPQHYVIVATGNIYEDAVQARTAARQGADIIAVIRSTGQSLLDFVPYGPTTEGFGGTYATQANFRIVREALDEVGEELGRYIRLCNYCSGLCMPEIAAMGALERLDVMLNDALYGILFRDINPRRTFIDQYYSRMINAYAGVVINTGEDNYLTTADAIEAAYTVTASQFINEQFASRSGLPPEQMGPGHAMEINPDVEDGFLLELAQAQLARDLFPDAPLKYMPPTKYMTGNIFRGHIQDALVMLLQSFVLLSNLCQVVCVCSTDVFV